MIITDQNHDVVAKFDECQSCNLPIELNDEVGVKTAPLLTLTFDLHPIRINAVRTTNKA